MTSHPRSLFVLSASAAFAGLLLSSGCANASGERGSRGAAPDGATAGCYYFDQDEVFRELRLPWGIRLTYEALEGFPSMARRGALTATTLTGLEERDHPFGYWVATAPDSLEVGYPAGGGLVLELEVQEDRGFTGVARPVGDAMPATGAADRRPRPVSLVWARCPGE